MSEPKQCEHIEKTPVFVKRLGNFVIDPSEYENENGAFLCYHEVPCRYVADHGHRFCPRHEMERNLSRRRDA